jgi:hypothetical protein
MRVIDRARGRAKDHGEAKKKRLRLPVKEDSAAKFLTRELETHAPEPDARARDARPEIL